MNIKPLTLIQRLRVHGVNAAAEDWATAEAKFQELNGYQATAALHGCKTHKELDELLLKPAAATAACDSQVAELLDRNEKLSEEISTLVSENKQLSDLIDQRREVVDEHLRLVRDLNEAHALEARKNEKLSEELKAFAEENAWLTVEIDQRCKAFNDQLSIAEKLGNANDELRWRIQDLENGAKQRSSFAQEVREHRFNLGLPPIEVCQV